MLLSPSRMENGLMIHSPRTGLQEEVHSLDPFASKFVGQKRGRRRKQWTEGCDMILELVPISVVRGCRRKRGLSTESRYWIKPNIWTVFQYRKSNHRTYYSWSGDYCIPQNRIRCESSNHRQQGFHISFESLKTCSLKWDSSSICL